MGVEVDEKDPVSSISGDHRNRLISEAESESSGTMDHLEPLELDDLKSYYKENDGINENDDGPIMIAPVNPIFSAAMQLKRRLSGGVELPKEVKTRAKLHWKTALKGLTEREDPWAQFHWDDMPTEKAIRYRYNPLSRKWTNEEVVLKIEEEPFGKGAMRECYRMKKLSNFSKNSKWDRDCNNYVAKVYMEDVSRETYFQDVRLQMDAKLWGEEFSRHNPPKKIDIFMMAVLEFVDRPGKPLYHVEHFIEGSYVKYNSNSGFVENAVSRQTPHAFSHFTFERSGHELMIVDVQGVGDLYTDPQIHTADGIGYGDGNLGTKGMALFFHSHACNAICRSLGLTKFDLTHTEKKERDLARSTSNCISETVCRDLNVIPCESPSDSVKSDLSQMFRARGRSISINVNDPVSVQQAIKADGGICRRRTYSDYYSMEEILGQQQQYEKQNSREDVQSGDTESSERSYLRERHMTECSDDSGIVNCKEILSFQEVIQNKARPSNIAAMKANDETHDDCILGMMHMDLAKYHEMCRFTTDGTFDHEAALFHLKCSAACGIIQAKVALAKMYFGMPKDILTEVEPEESMNDEEKQKEGFKYMVDAATAEDRSSMVFVAKAYDTGLNLYDSSQKSAKTAMEWYEKVAHKDELEGGDCTDWGMDDPPYAVLSRMAELWLAGEDGLKKDPNQAGELYNQAAESAMNCMKGKMANKFYMLAEEAFGQIEEEEEE